MSLIKKAHFFVVFWVVIISVDSGVIKPQENIRLISYNVDISDSYGGKSFSYEQSDGQKRSEEVYIRKLSDDVEILVIRGFYSFMGTNGIVYTVRYVADENGYQPTFHQMPVEDVEKVTKKPSRNRIAPNALKSLIG